MEQELVKTLLSPSVVTIMGAFFFMLCLSLILNYILIRFLYKYKVDHLGKLVDEKLMNKMAPYKRETDTKLSEYTTDITRQNTIKWNDLKFLQEEHKETQRTIIGQTQDIMVHGNQIDTVCASNQELWDAHRGAIEKNRAETLENNREINKETKEIRRLMGDIREGVAKWAGFMDAVQSHLNIDTKK